MKQHTTFRFGLSVALLAISAGAFAHGDHEDMPKLKPYSCEQLADRENYSNDLADPDIKALKDKCDAERAAKADAEKAGKDE